MAPGGLPFPVRMRPPPEGLERKEGATGREGGEEQPEEEEEEIPAPDPIAGENVSCFVFSIAVSGPSIVPVYASRKHQHYIGNRHYSAC